MANYLAAMYNQQMSQGTDDDQVQFSEQSVSPGSLQAVNDAEAAMAYCRDEVLPHLVMQFLYHVLKYTMLTMSNRIQ